MLVGILVGLYPIFHHTSDHGVSAYQNLVSATCVCIDNIESHATPFPDPVSFHEGSGSWLYNKAAVIENLDNLYTGSQRTTDQGPHNPPKPLEDKYRR